MSDSGKCTDDMLPHMAAKINKITNRIQYNTEILTSGYATWFTAGGAIRIAHYDVIDDVIIRKL